MNKLQFGSLDLGLRPNKISIKGSKTKCASGFQNYFLQGLRK